jgi:hypothetical protein
MPAAVSLSVGARDAYADLGLVECFRVDFLVKSFGDRGALQDAVLPEEKPVFESELREREADNEALPRKQWPV